MSAQAKAQTPTQSPTPSSAEDSKNQQTGLARRGAVVPAVSSLLFDPFGFFDDSPFSTLRRLQQEMNRVFSPASNMATRADDSSVAVWIPPLEVDYRDGNLVVSAELPGLTENDVKVEVNNDMLTIQGERKVEQEKTEGGVHRTERRYGQFHRAIALPEGADAEHAKAEMQNGVLQITIPVPQTQTNTRQIPVHASQSTGSSQKAPASSTSSSEKAA